MSIIEPLIGKLARWHWDRVQAKYSKRYVRPLNFFKGAISSSFQSDTEKYIFNHGFYEKLYDIGMSYERNSTRYFKYFYLTTFVLFALLVKPGMQATWANLRLEDIGIFADLIIIAAGFSIYRGVVLTMKIISIAWTLSEYVKYVTQSTSYIIQDDVRALLNSRFGESYLDYVADRIVIKGKYIAEPYIVKGYIDSLNEILFLASLFFSCLIWLFFSFRYILHPPIAWPISLLSITIFWIFVFMAILHLIMFISISTGLLASGRRENTED